MQVQNNIFMSDKRIIQRLEEEGGEFRSLFKLAIEIEMAYYLAHRSICKLERLHILEVERHGAGRPLVMRLARNISSGTAGTV